MTDNRNIYNSAVQIRQDYRKGAVALSTFLTVLSVIFAVAELVLLILYNDIFDNVLWFMEKSKLVIFILSLLLVLDIVYIITSSIRISCIKKSFICVTDEGVYGLGCSKSFYKSKPFALYYNQITKLSVKDALTIESGGESYNLDVRKMTDVIASLTVNLVSYYKKSGNFVWICDKCGSVNAYNGEVCNSCGYVRKLKPQNDKRAVLINDIIMTAPKCHNKDEFVKAMSVIGYTLVWNEANNAIFFICSNGQKYLDTSLGDSRCLLQSIRDAFIK